jgi:hypothetical protein
MNKHHHRLIFNASRGCMMAVAETADSCSKSRSTTSSARARSSKLRKTPLNSQFPSSNTPLAQVTCAQAAPECIVKGSAALNVYNNAKDIGDAAKALASGNPMDALTISLAYGTSKSQSNQASQADTAKGSSLTAGGNVNVTALGAGKDSNLAVQGSQITAGNSAALTADGQVNLLAAKNDSSQAATQSASSSSVGVSYSVMTQSVGFSASASKGQGKSDGQDLSYTHTTIAAGNTATVKSGGDTKLEGAVVTANTIKANVGTSGQGSLTIESLQDTSTYTSKQSSSGGSISVGGGAVTGGSVSASKSNIDSTFNSVNQQSGLKAGDGGFQVTVNNNTDLKGGAITSTQKAVDDKANTFSTGGKVTTTDVQNSASYKGTAVGGTLGVGSQLGSSGAGAGNTEGKAASTSSAGISGVAGSAAVRTTDLEAGLKPIFNADKAQKEIDAQVKITTSFGQQASKSVGDYAGNKLKEAIANKDQAEIDKWKEGGSARVGLHTVVGLLTGNVSGAVGAGTSQAVIPYIGEQIAKLDVPIEVKQALIQLAGTAVGAATGGVSGGASALGITANNYLNHVRINPRTGKPDFMRLSEKEQYDLASAACSSSGDKAACGARDELAAISAQRDKGLQQACGPQGSTVACNVQVNQAKEMGNVVSGTYGQGAMAYTSDTNSPTRALMPASLGPVNDVRLGTFQDKAGKSTAEAFLLGGASAGSVAAFQGALTNGKNIFQAYQAAQQAHNLGTAAVTSGGVGLLLYGGGEAVKSGVWYHKNDVPLSGAVQHWQNSLNTFDAANSAVWSAVGGAATTQAFKLSGIANDSIFKQLANPTSPVIVIRANTMATGQAGKAATDAALNPKRSDTK